MDSFPVFVSVRPHKILVISILYIMLKEVPDLEKKFS